MIYSERDFLIFQFDITSLNELHITEYHHHMTNSTHTLLTF